VNWLHAFRPRLISTFSPAFLYALAVGDAPVAYARWRAVTAASIDPPAPGVAPDGRAVLVIDRLLVLKEYRQRGFSKNVLQVGLLTQFCLQQRRKILVAIAGACAGCAG
jgi:GNAT superfamily N-acetyltransferase